MPLAERHPVRADETDLETLSDIDRLLRQRNRPAVLIDDSQRIELPQPLFDIFCQAAEILMRGGAVSIMSYDTVLTTQEAADYLGVSRPHLIKLLDRGEIPFDRDDQPGSHRRIQLRDLEDYQGRKERRRRKALADITRENYELGLYDVDSEAEVRGST